MSDNGNNYIDLFKLGRQIGQLTEAVGNLKKDQDSHRSRTDQQHQENVQTLAEISNDMRDIRAAIEPVTKDVLVMKPQVAKLMDFQARWGFVIATAATIASVAIYVLWEGIKFAASLGKEYLLKLVH